MKKTLFLLLSSIVFLVGCNNDEYNISNENQQSLNKIKWYGVSNSDSISTRGVADAAKLWNQNSGIPIKFINSPATASTIEKIKSIAKEWETYAGIKFHFLDSDKKADVRIAFDWNDNDYLTWSYTGTDAKKVTNQNEPTAVFGGLQYSDEEQFRGDVLRVFGQILGLEYEQRHQDWSFWKNEIQLKKYWISMFDGMNFNWDELRDYVFTPLSGTNAIFPTQTDQIDELSIMAWPYYSKAQTTKLIANYELSETDKQFIAKLYPKNEKELPTIQEAWVNTGFFEWRTKENSPEIWEEGMVALKITEKGLEQNTFPDVSDGEQLTSAYLMFSYNNPIVYAKIKKVPTFNTSNIKDFTGMFQGCYSLINIPPFDTSSGTNFSKMFQSCGDIIIPLFDTSNGLDFSEMFASSGIQILPQLNTSKGTNFSNMFNGCYMLHTIPLLDTSNGISFNHMFAFSSIYTIPMLNTSAGTDFAGMFKGCASLSKIPLIDTSNGFFFDSMFQSCYHLKKIPFLNILKGVAFNWMFKDCESLEEKPKMYIMAVWANAYDGTPYEYESKYNFDNIPYPDNL